MPTTDEPPTHQHQPERPVSVLIVDDDPPFRLALGRALTSQCGATIHHALNGLHALTILTAGMAKGVDVVVTDYNMPGFDGLELADQIKQRWPNLPVVIVTGYPGVEMASRPEV
ncbi:MAG TPA: response regulator [Polyangiaceae bacterium]|nr:response regulator [Polyangiaceae bacterium]